MMNLIKSFFIALAPLILITALFNGATLLYKQQPLMGLSMILSSAPLLLFLSYILIFKSVARTGKHMWPVQSVSLLGLILGLFTFTFELMPLLVFSGLSYVITLLYIYWYSDNQRKANQPLSIGEKLPAFTIKDHMGKTINSTNADSHPMILMFTRGNWCPLCMAQIKEVADAYHALAKAGIKVMIVASQAEHQTQKLAKKFDVPLTFLIDQDQQLGKQLGIIHHNGLPLGFQVLGYQSDQYYPSVIATDSDGQIIYSDQTSNYRLRPEPEELLKIYSP